MSGVSESTVDLWLGRLPASWSVKRLGALGVLVKGRGGTKEDNRDSGVPVVRYGDLYTKFGIRITDSLTYVNEEDAAKYTPLPTHSIVFAASGESVEEIGRSALSLLSDPAVVGGDTIVFHPGDEIDPLYLSYALESSPLRAHKAARATGFTVVHISAARLKTLPIPVPPHGQQRAIVDYLDRETASIDMLIEEQRILISMLRERRDSAWASCVEAAQRLGPRVTVRRTIESIVDGPFGSSLTSAHYADEGVRVIRLGNIGINKFKDGDAVFISPDYADELDAHAVKQGDVVVAGLGDDRMPLGRAAAVPALGRAIVKADCYRLRPKEQVSAAYLAWAMSAPQTRSQIMLLARGATRARLNTKVVQEVEIPLPDRSVQDELVARSNAESARIDGLIGESERFLELAQERRAALITAAVTGQIDVREMA